MRARLTLLLTVAFEVGAAAVAPPSTAQPDSGGRPALALEARSPLAQQADETRAKPAHWDFTDHPRLVLGDDSFVDFRLKLQWDYRTFSPTPRGAVDETDWALVRVGVEGQITRFVEFEVSRELGAADDSWRAVYVNVRPLAAFQVQGGHFKVPFSRERLTGPTNLDFTQRAVGVRAIAPGYDTGVMLHGRVAKRRLAYSIGIFEGTPDEVDRAVDEPLLPGVAPLRRYDGRLWAWRVTGRPLAWESVPAWLRRLELGVNATRSHRDEGLNGWRGRAAFRQEFFPAVYVNGTRSRFGADAEFVSGPVALCWEYIQGLDERRGQGVADDDLPDLEARSWSLAIAAVMTGEKKVDVERPHRPLRRGGIGALEVAARLERFGLGSRDAGGDPPSYSPRGVNLAGNQDAVWTVGVNWYPDRFFRVQLNAIRERFDDRTRTPLVGRDTYWSYVVRAQFVL